MQTLRIGSGATGPDGATEDAIPSPPPPSQLELALLDIVQGARASHLWGMLGWQDIRRRYRRSKIGPFWLTISLGVLVAVLGSLYGALFRVESAEYVPFLALGFIVWMLITGVVTDSCNAFIGARGIVKEVALPHSVHVYRVLWRNLIIFFHNAAIFVLVAVFFSLWPSWVGLLAIPGMVLLCLNGMWTGLLLGIVSARFRDVPPIVASVTRLAFFVTPIIWMPSLVPRRAAFVEFNPFYHFLELVRAPLLGELPGLVSWMVVFAITVGGWTVTLAVFRRYRWRISYWA